MSPRPHRKAESVQELLARLLPLELLSEEGFARWFLPWRERVMVVVTEVHALVVTRLEEERRRILSEEDVTRAVWGVTGTDGRSLLKSSASARSKIGRELQRRKETGQIPPGRMSLEQIELLLLSFPDLGRFRIVCDFSSDVDRARKVLLPGKTPILLERYPVTAIKDYVYDLGLRHPARGHRAYQFAARVPAGGRSFLVEIQLMTLLQEAWDRRNHGFYEWTRDGGSAPAQLTLRDVALAEALHLMDLQATQNWKAFLKAKRAQKGSR